MSKPAGWPRAIVFDLDGTLIDSAPDIALAFNRLLAERGIKTLPAGDVANLIGDGVVLLVERGFAAAGAVLDKGALAEAVARFLALHAERPVVETVPYEGVVDLLDRLTGAGVPIGICTNKSGHLTDLVLAALGWSERFQAVVPGDGPAGRKPAPGSLLETLRLLNVTPGDAVMVGDSINDVRAARAAGTPVVVAGYGYCHDEPSALGGDVVITHASELVAALDSLKT